MGDILEQLIAQILEGHAAAVAQVVAEFRDTHISPPLTSPSSRAVTFTPPNKSPSLTITSPTLMPMRKCIDGASGWTSSAFASFLDLDGTVYGVERAGKFGEHTIAGGVRDPAPAMECGRSTTPHVRRFAQGPAGRNEAGSST
jgi:hypothetical protein